MDTSCSLDLFIFTINAVKSSWSLLSTAAGFCTWRVYIFTYCMGFYMDFLLIVAHPFCHFGIDINLKLPLLFSHLPPSSSIFLFSSPFAHFPSHMLCIYFFSLLSLLCRLCFALGHSCFWRGSLSHWFPASPSLWARHSGPLTPLSSFTHAVIA